MAMIPSPDRSDLLEQLRGLVVKWRQQIADEEAWVPGQPMKLSNEELGQLSQCADELDTLLSLLDGPRRQEPER